MALFVILSPSFVSAALVRCSAQDVASTPLCSTQGMGFGSLRSLRIYSGEESRIRTFF